MPSRDPTAVTVVVGDEELLVSRAVRAAVQSASDADPQPDVHDVDAATLDPGDLDGLFSPSLFSERRVVVLRDAHNLGKEVAAELTSYAVGPLPEISLVIVVAGGQKGRALGTALAAAGAFRVDVPTVTKLAERRDFVRAELRAGGRPFEDEAVFRLVEAVGNDLRELSSACSQVLSDTEGPVTLDAVLRYHRGRAEASGFAVAERAVEGDLSGALELLRWGQATGLAHVLVTSALASTLRAIAMVASAHRSAPVGQLASQLGMPPWKIEMTRRQARSWLPEGLSEALQAVAGADAAVKGEAADQDYAVEQVLLRVVQARGAAR